MSATIEPSARNGIALGHNAVPARAGADARRAMKIMRNDNAPRQPLRAPRTFLRHYRRNDDSNN